MLRIRHDPPGAPAPLGGYTQAVELERPERLLLVSGQIPEPAGGEAPADFEAQCRQVWRNLVAALEAAGMTVRDLVKVTTFLTDRDQAAANGRIRREFLPEDARPALTVIVAQTLDAAWQLEIEGIAAR